METWPPREILNRRFMCMKIIMRMAYDVPAANKAIRAPPWRGPDCPRACCSSSGSVEPERSSRAVNRPRGMDQAARLEAWCEGGRIFQRQTERCGAVDD